MRNETIGQHIKRLILIKAAEYLKYSNIIAADIALSVGYADSATFSKAFKKEFGCAPSGFREKHQLLASMGNNQTGKVEPPDAIPFEIRDTPEYRVLYCQYEGSYDNKEAMLALCDELIGYASQQNLLLAN